MSNATESLILDLLEWLSKADRTYADTMEHWRTSCPRLPVWEDANDRALVTRVVEDGQALVRLSPTGRSVLEHDRIRRLYCNQEETKQD